ncbi:MAG: DUF1963 domain-containing protein [Oscillospiraceae bacterium]|nr:DUF1963 domain-containing protein [Oscillospiraceae bacterium]
MKKTPCIRIRLTDTKPDIFESKVGGYGYIPHNGDFPHDQDGNQLRFLAQIDCSEIDFEPFPKSGLLQFWIFNDDLYGCDFGNPEQNKFRILYYPEIDQTVTEEEIASKFIKSAYDEENLFPVDQECGMTFTSGESCQRPDFDADEEDWNAYDLLFTGDSDQEPQITGSLHQIGGYPYFTQDDPREEDSEYDFLLFQLDSDSDKILWGDMGIGNFFINSQKLKALDFSDVLYNWDCG